MSKCQTLLWDKGWYRWAQRLDSPHFGSRPAATPVTLGVIHCISLPPDQYGAHHIEQFFMGQLDVAAHPYFQTISDLKVSAHFLVKRNGDLIQFVSVDDRAWHAGVSEFMGQANCNDFSVGIELEGNDSSAFEMAQYDTLFALSQSLQTHYPIGHWVGHSEIAPNRKTDPGSGFEWNRFHKALGN
jgi:AmpD protein